MFSIPHPKTTSVDGPAGAGAGRRLSAWTPERTRRAARLYLEEGFTAEEVAFVLGPPFSRASVVGKMRRIGCLKRDLPGSGEADAPKPAPRRPRRESPWRKWIQPPRWPPQPLPPLREVGPTGSPVTLAALPASGACRWPIDDPGAGRMHLTLFCGGPAGRHVYCEAHRAIAAQRPT